MVAEVNKILKSPAICNSCMDWGMRTLARQLTNMPRAGETAVLFGWIHTPQPRRCSQEKYRCDGEDDRV